LPSLEHEVRVAFLNDLAILAGFHHSAPMDVVIGIPDTLRLSLPSGDIFIGDAKATETAGCEETRRRIGQYLNSAHRYLWHTSRTLVFALCVPTSANPLNWVRSIQEIAAESGLEFGKVTWRYIGSGYQLIYFFAQAAVTTQRADAASHLRAVSGFA
jgi:hypothetical protein